MLMAYPLLPFKTFEADRCPAADSSLRSEQKGPWSPPRSSD
jgi:hypothetical protein